MGTPRNNRNSSVGRSFLTVATGELSGQLATMVRGIIIVRSIGMEQMGIVATLLIMVDFLGRLANLNPSITLVQDRYGASRGFRHTLQAILLLRGTVIFVILTLLAWPLAVFYQQEPHLAGFYAVALIPLLMGLPHVDVWRQLRNRKYKPQAILSSMPNLGSLVVTIIAAIWIQNFWLPIIARLSGGILAIWFSFRLARRRYGIALRRADVTRILRFIIPLMGAGVLAYFSGQGMTFFIASGPTIFKTISVEQVTLVLGVLYVGFRLCGIPDVVGSKLIQATWSPRLARSQDDPPLFRKIMLDMQAIAYLMAAGVIILLGVGTTWVLLIYGRGAIDAGPVVGLLSIYSGLRLGRVAMRATALSTGNSSYLLWSNLASGMSIVGIILSMVMVESSDDKLRFLSVWIPASMIVGELCSLVTINILLQKGRLKIGFSDLWMRPMLIVTTAVAWMLVERLAIDMVDTSTATGLVLAALSSVGFAAAYLVAGSLAMSRTRDKTLNLLRSVIAR